MQGLLRNLKILPWFSALRNFDALLPFFVLYTQQWGLTYFDFFITQIVYSIPIFDRQSTSHVIKNFIY